MSLTKKNLFAAVTLFGGIFFFQNCTDDAPQNEAVIVAQYGEPDVLNPALVGNGYARQVYDRHIFPPLTDNDPQTLQVVPILAKDLPTITPIDTGKYKGGTAYTYEILPEAIWDNGSPVTANDYIFSVKAILNPKCATEKFRAYADFIKNITIDATNPKRFTVFSEKAYILGEATTSYIPMLPAYHYDEKNLMSNFTISELSDKQKVADLVIKDLRLTDFANDFNIKFNREKGKVSGCGAYQLEAWETGKRIVLAKKSGHWTSKLASPRPLLAGVPNKIEYHFYQSATAALTELRDNKISAMSAIPAADFAKLNADAKFTSNYTLFTIPTTIYTGVNINNKNPKLTDKRVRRALAHLMNVAEIIKTLQGGMAQAISSPIAPIKEHSAKNLVPIAYDVEQAKRLLAEAGWKDSNNNGTLDKMIGSKLTELNLAYLTANKFPGTEIAQIFQNAAKQAGVAIEIMAKDPKISNEEAKKGNYELQYFALSQDVGLDDLEQRWSSKSTDNFCKFGTTQSDVLIEKINQTLDKNQRNALYQTFQQLVYDEQPVIFLYNPQERIAISKQYKSAKPTSIRPYYFEHLFE